MKKASKRKISFIVVWCCLILVTRSEAQQGASGKVITMPGKLVFDTGIDWSSHWSDVSKPAEVKPLWNTRAPAALQVLMADYYIQSVGFFCKKEWKFEKSTRVPLKFRLGSLDYVNHLEGK